MELAYKALSDKSRRKILKLLGKKTCSVMELVERLRIRQSTLSCHLKILRQAGLVGRTVNGKQRIYRIEKEKVVKLAGAIRQFAGDGNIEEIKVRGSRV